MHDFIAFVHARLAVALILMALLLGLLGTYQFFRHKALGPGFRSAYLLMVGLTVVQCLAGLAQLATGVLHQPLHIVYGIFAIAFLPGVLVYAGRTEDRPREAMLLAVACWFVLIAFVRARATGSV